MFCCTSSAVWSVGRTGGRSAPGLQHNDGSGGCQQQEACVCCVGSFRRTRNAAANAVFTTMISNDSPYTPVTCAIRASGMLSTCVTPSRSQGKPVMRVRASSTATQATGASKKRSRLNGLVLRPPSPTSRSVSRTGRDRGPGTGRKEGAAPERQATQPAVLAHGVVDPVAGPGIPENSARIGQQERLGGLAGSSLMPVCSCRVSGSRPAAEPAATAQPPPSPGNTDRAGGRSESAGQPTAAPAARRSYVSATRCKNNKHRALAADVRTSDFGPAATSGSI